MKNKDNIQPSVNPKPLTVQRFENYVTDKDGHASGMELLFIKNVKINPYELLKK